MYIMYLLYIHMHVFLSVCYHGKDRERKYAGTDCFQRQSAPNGMAWRFREAEEKGITVKAVCAMTQFM